MLDDLPQRKTQRGGDQEDTMLVTLVEMEMIRQLPLFKFLLFVDMKIGNLRIERIEEA